MVRGYLIGRRPSGSPEEDMRRARVGYSLPGTEEGAGNADESVAKGGQMPYLTATQSIILKYFEVQQCQTNG